MESNDTVTLSEKQALSLWLQGKDAWNLWANKHPNAYVAFNIDDLCEHAELADEDEATGDKVVSFNGFIFPGDLEISDGKFTAAVLSFKGATFLSDVTIRSAKFSNTTIDFSEVTFHTAWLTFARCEFDFCALDFEGSAFNKSTLKLLSTQGSHVEFIFNNTKSEQSTLDFDSSKFHSSILSFFDAYFTRSVISFLRCEFQATISGYKNTLFNQTDTTISHSMFKDSVITYLDSTFQECKLFEVFITTIDGQLTISNSLVDIEKCSFTHSNLKGAVDFSRSTFSSLPDLTSTNLTHPVEFSNVVFKRLAKERGFLWLKKNTDKKAAAKLRKLLDIASDGKNQRMVLDMFAEELKAKRFHETTGLELIPNYLYQWTSDFGRSMLRPILCLIFMAVVFAGIFVQSATVQSPSFWAALKLSISQLLPFTPWSKKASTSAEVSLFENINHIPDAVHYAAMTETILSVILIGLFALAARNRFKLR